MINIAFKKIKSLKLILENCEVLKFDSKDIGRLSIGELRRKLYQHHNTLIDSTYTDHFSVIINSEANVEYFPFGIEDEPQHKFERLLQCKDIVGVDIKFDNDESTGKIGLSWLGDSDYMNEAQRVYRNENGDLMIIVNDNESDDEALLKQFNDIQRYMESVWKFNK